jgi:hypothetical protein
MASIWVPITIRRRRRTEGRRIPLDPLKRYSTPDKEREMQCPSGVYEKTSHAPLPQDQNHRRPSRQIKADVLAGERNDRCRDDLGGGAARIKPAS